MRIEHQDQKDQDLEQEVLSNLEGKLQLKVQASEFQTEEESRSKVHVWRPSSQKVVEPQEPCLYRTWTTYH